MARRPNPLRRGFFNSPGFAAGSANLASLFAPPEPRFNPASSALAQARADQIRQEMAIEARERADASNLADVFGSLAVDPATGTFTADDMRRVNALALRAGAEPEGLAFLLSNPNLSEEGAFALERAARGPVSQNEFLTAGARDAAIEADLANTLQQEAMRQAGATQREQMGIDALAGKVAAETGAAEALRENRLAQAEASRRFTTPSSSRTSVISPGGEVQELVPLADAFLESEAALTEQRLAAAEKSRREGPGNPDMQNVVFPDGSVEMVDLNDPVAAQDAAERGGQRFAKRQQAATVGELTQSARSKQIAGLQEREIAFEQVKQTANALKTLIKENPASLGSSGALSRTATSMAAQAENLARLAGVEVNASLDPADYEMAFEQVRESLPSRVAQTAIDSAIVRSNITSLAYAAAAASGQEGRDVSNRDVERFILEIGGATGSPETFIGVLDDFVARQERNLKIRQRALQRRSERSATEPSVVIDYDAQGNRIGEGIE